MSYKKKILPTERKKINEGIILLILCTLKKLVVLHRAYNYYYCNRRAADCSETAAGSEFRRRYYIEK